MKRETEEYLFSLAPEFFNRTDLRVSAMGFGFEVGDGWAGIIEGGIKALKNWIYYGYDSQWPDGKYPHKYQVVQVKEKYGTMRWYAYGEDERARSIGNAIEMASSLICEFCGASGKLRTRGWWHTLCDSCEEDYHKGRRVYGWQSEGPAKEEEQESQKLGEEVV
jgi:hypothetical protein